MVHARLATVFTIIFLAGFGLSLPFSQAQILTEPAKKQEAAFQRIQKLLDEPLIEAKQFPLAMPLAKFLEALDKQLPQEWKITLPIDQDAFGDKLKEVAGTPILVPPFPKKTSLRNIMKLVIAKTKTKTDYRLGRAEVAITTPERALFTAAYDIRDIMAKPEVLAFSGWHSFKKDWPIRLQGPAHKAALIVQAVSAAMDSEKPGPITPEGETIQVLNGTRLVIRANAARHALADSILQAFRRLGDVAVNVKARLYEVDQAFFTKLKNTKPINWEEQERHFLAGLPIQGESLFKSLAKQRLVLTGETVKMDDGQESAILSWHQAVRCLPSPDFVGKTPVSRGDNDRQTVLVGVSFLAEVGVSPDRRHVRLKLTEKATELQKLKRTRVIVDNSGKWLNAETPFMIETAHAVVLEIPDGGSILVPVHYRPSTVQAHNRRWVLSINPRIYIEEEEKQIRQGKLVE